MCPTPGCAGRHAWAGGLFVAAGIELAKKLLTLYLSKVPTYSVVYGAFATVPILLVWIYVAWVIVLLGAVIAAYLPSLLAGVARRGSSARAGSSSWRSRCCSSCDQARSTARIGLEAAELAEALQVDALQLEPVLETLVALDWMGQLETMDGGRYVLLADPDDHAAGAADASALLLTPSPRTAFMTINGMKSSSMLREAL